MLPLIILAYLLAQSGPPKGFGYSLSCSFAGEEASCWPESKLDHLRIDHFELIDEGRKVRFRQDAPRDQTFSEVGAQFEGPGGFTGLDIHWGSFDPANAKEIAGHISSAQLLRIIADLNGDPRNSIVSTFEITPSGLVPSTPVLCPHEGDIGTATGRGVECNVETAYFRFEAELRNDFNQPETLLPNLFTVFPASHEYSPKRLNKSAELRVYSDHRTTATSSDTTAQTGMLVTWLSSQEQSNQEPEAPPEQGVEIMAAWASLKLVPGSGQFAGLEVASYDKNDLWLQVRLNRVGGWIHGDASFRAVGLP
jgi:hypothetical protein